MSGIFDSGIFDSGIFDEEITTSTTTTLDRSDGKPRHKTGDEELTEAEAQWMQRKLADLRLVRHQRLTARPEVSVPVPVKPAWQEYRIDHAALEQEAQAAERIRAEIATKLGMIGALAASQQRRLKEQQRKRNEEEALLLLSL